MCVMLPDVVGTIGRTSCMCVCSRDYRKDVLYPVMQHIARRCGQPELYEGLLSDLDPLIQPRGASEMEVKMRQVQIHSFIQFKYTMYFELALATLGLGELEG